MYSSALERDAKRLRKAVEAVKTGGPSATTSITISGNEEDDARAFLENIEDSCKIHEQRMQDIDQKLHGSLDNRLIHISSADLLEKCSRLYEANQIMIKQLDQYTSKFDPNKRAIVVEAKTKQQPVNDIENQENIININTADDTNNIDRGDESINDHADVTVNESTILVGELVDNDEEDIEENDNEDNEIKEESIREPMASLSQSPPSQSPPSHTSDIVDNKTPTLLDWKLSEATRKIVNTKGAAAVSPPMNNNTYNKDDDIIETPQKFQLSYNDSSDTPTTPTIGTPFQTCDLKSSYKTGYMSSNKNKSPEAQHDDLLFDSMSPMISVKPDYNKIDEVVEVEVPVIVNDVKAFDECNISKDSDTSIGFMSPPKMAKILEPRKNETTSNKIPAISDEEWSTAPVFLKKQVTLDIVNKALVSINNSLMDSEKRDTLTQMEMDETISNIDSSIPPKAVILALVQLKKLDLGTDSSKQKVYKIRRFY